MTAGVFAGRQWRPINVSQFSNRKLASERFSQFWRELLLFTSQTKCIYRCAVLYWLDWKSHGKHCDMTRGNNCYQVTVDVTFNQQVHPFNYFYQFYLMERYDGCSWTDSQPPQLRELTYILIFLILHNTFLFNWYYECSIVAHQCDDAFSNLKMNTFHFLDFLTILLSNELSNSFADWYSQVEI